MKGFEVSDGEYVVLEQDEIAAAAGERSHVIDVDAFVDAGAIDPVFYEQAQERDIPGRPSMSKRDLVKALSG